MKHQLLTPPGMVSRWAGVLAISVLSVLPLTAEITNDAPSPLAASKSRIPDFDDLTVKGVRLAPGGSGHSGVDGQGLVSLEAPGTSLSANVPLPAGGTSSNKNEFVAAPIPSLSPTFGFGLALGAAYIYHPFGAGPDSPPWMTGGGGFYTENGSWGAGVGHKMNWNEDRWRLLGALAYADLRYDFFGVGEGAGDAGQSIPLRQSMAGGVVELLREVGHRWYLGGRLLYGHVTTSLDQDNVVVPPLLAGIPLELSADLSAFGLRLQRDTRDNSFSPTRGTLLNFEANFFGSAWGSDFTFQTYAVAYNHYFPLTTNHVLALRGYGRGTSGDAPFFALSSFGTGADLRGYTPGRYRDQLMIAVQAEYRWRITERFGVVAFGGVGGVAPEIGQFDKLLPSVGVGARYVLAKKNNVSLRFDAAWGRDEHTFYVGIGEAF